MLMSSMPSHLGWDAGANAEDEAEAHQLAEHGRELMKAAIDSHQKSRGTIPGHIMQLIRQMLLPPTVPWTEFLQTIIQRTRQTKKKRGMQRPSKTLAAMKKYAELQTKKLEAAQETIQEGGELLVLVHDIDGNPITDEEEIPERIKQLLRRHQYMKRIPVFPGIKHSNKYTMVYAVDTSGSMGIAELQSGLNELQHVQKSDSDIQICVMYCDTRVCTEYWIGANNEIDPELTGRGGTDFNPIFERVAELLRTPDKAPDILIFCTDGWAPPPTIRLPIPVVWLITPRGKPVVEEAGHITIEMRDYQLGESH
jgi:predicted metal-dependent peptidase